MKVGIVAEGPSDVAVLRNILKGRLGLEKRDALAIRPELAADETDLGDPGRGGAYRAPTEREQSNWLLVLRECEARERIAEFLDNQIDEERFVVVQIDTAEAHLPGYDVVRPPDRKAATYTDELRQQVIEKINGLLGPKLARRVRHAVAVEEIDAWVLTLHDDTDRDTGSFMNPKKRLEEVVMAPGSKGRSTKGRDRAHPRGGGRGRDAQKQSPYEKYHELTQKLRDRNRLAECAARNRSLMLFVSSL